MRYLFYSLLLGCLLFSCKQDANQTTASSTKEKVADKLDYRLPDWAKAATLYEVNLRQYTPEGSFQSFIKHLPRLKKMGVDILWFMPIFPISEAKRKGPLGSYYAVADYKAVNSEHGTMADFEAMVKAIHDQGMFIILDWVPNHTGWDHPWIEMHKDWYTQDSLGNIIDPIDPGTGESWGWTDVADLNYDKAAMRAEMISDMSYWVQEKNIDGFRMDVAHNVPDDFWAAARDSLFGLERDIFMLAEAEMENHRNSESFHASYGWHMHHVLNGIAKGERTALDIDTALIEDAKKFKKGFHIQFTSNHDENTWSGTVMDRMGEAHKTLAALTATFDGMPLVYGGQEEPLRHRLKFFEKDDIGFKNYDYEEFYTKLLQLKHSNKAIWNGSYGGPLTKLLTDEKVYAFKRSKEGNEVIGIFNLTKERTSITLPESIQGKDIMTGQSVDWKKDTALGLEPWQYYILTNG